MASHLRTASSWSMLWRWLCAEGNRPQGSSTIPIVGLSTRRSLSASAWRRQASSPRWEGRDLPWTTPSPNLSCPRSNVSSSTVGPFPPGRPQGAPSSSTWRRSTTHQVNTPLNHQEPEAPAEEVEVTDPAHPLFGRRFEILSVHDAPGLVGHVHVSHRGHMHIRIELRATDLAPSPPPLPATKLTSQAVIELAQLAGQCEVLYAAQPAQRCLGKPIAGGPNSSHKGDVNDPHGGDR